MTDHALTRRDMVVHVRSIRRSIKRALATLNTFGEDHEFIRGRVAEQLEAAMRRCDDAKLSLTKAMPRRIHLAKKRAG